MSVVLLERKNVKFVARMKQCMICQSKRVAETVWWDKDSESMSKVIISVLHPSWALCAIFVFFCLQEVRVLLLSLHFFLKWGVLY